MQSIGEIVKLPEFPPEIQVELNRRSALSLAERLQEDCDRENSQPGKLDGYDCPLCMNRGYNAVVRDDTIVHKLCGCQELRKSMRRIEQSGIANLLASCTFEFFVATTKWQRNLKAKAEQFITDCTSGKWFYAGGQVGSGKTHICTAIVGKLLEAGMSARYVLWRDAVVQLKACVNDDTEYSRLITPLKSVDVLYIDDLFKTGAGNAPTAADVNVAFEILNHRYINRQLVTIISGERNMDELMFIDEAVGSRIYERTKEYCIVIEEKPENNYRMRKE